MDATRGLAAILRDTLRDALLRMRAETTSSYSTNVAVSGIPAREVR
jgi:hypothetical protein